MGYTLNGGGTANPQGTIENTSSCQVGQGLLVSLEISAPDAVSGDQYSIRPRAGAPIAFSNADVTLTATDIDPSGNAKIVFDAPAGFFSAGTFELEIFKNTDVIPVACLKTSVSSTTATPLSPATPSPATVAVVPPVVVSPPAPPAPAAPAATKQKSLGWVIFLTVVGTIVLVGAIASAFNFFALPGWAIGQANQYSQHQMQSGVNTTTNGQNTNASLPGVSGGGGNLVVQGSGNTITMPPLPPPTPMPPATTPAAPASPPAKQFPNKHPGKCSGTPKPPGC